MSPDAILSNYTYVFVLTMARYLGLFIITPILGSRVVLTRVKIGLALLLAVITMPMLSELEALTMPQPLILVLSDLIRELAIGFFMGFIVYLVFAAIQLAGQFIDLRMGFRIANVVDPMTGASSPVVGQFKNIVAMLVFLAIDGHLVLLQSLYKSFEIIPLGEAVFTNQLWQLIFRKSADIFILAFKISLPVIGTLFVVDITLGFLARAVPQMNIFIIGLPIKIFFGFVILVVSAHLFIGFFDKTFQETFKNALRVIKLMTPE